MKNTHNSKFGANTNNVIQLQTRTSRPLAPSSTESIINLDELQQSDKLYCTLHGYAYCFATLLKALPQEPLIDSVWQNEFSDSLEDFESLDKKRRFTNSFSELFFQLKYKLFADTAVMPEIFHRRPDSICDDSPGAPLHRWLSGIVSALALTKQVPNIWLSEDKSTYGELLLGTMTRTVNEFCEKHQINKQFIVDSVFAHFQEVVDREYASQQAQKNQS